MANTNLTEKKEGQLLTRNATVTEMLEYVIALYGITDVSEVLKKIDQKLSESN